MTTTDTLDLDLPSPLQEIANTLAGLDVVGYTLHATSPTYYTARNPDATEGARKIGLRLTIIGRTHFETVARHYAAKVTERIVIPGQRSWWAEADTAERRLLIEGVSFQHHDDWEPRS